MYFFQNINKYINIFHLVYEWFSIRKQLWNEASNLKCFENLCFSSTKLLDFFFQFEVILPFIGFAFINLPQIQISENGGVHS